MSLQGEHDPSIGAGRAGTVRRLAVLGAFGKMVPASLVPVAPEEGSAVSLGAQNVEAIYDPDDSARLINPKYPGAKASMVRESLVRETSTKPADAKRVNRDSSKLRLITATHKAISRRAGL